MGHSFTKLFASITESTIWQEPDHTRLVWIAMLAKADRQGVVLASIPGLAHLARVTLEQAEEALRTLSSPDKYSRTPDNEGRRIESCQGGWRLLNHALYRGMMDAESVKESKRNYMRRTRGEAVKSGTYASTVEDGGTVGSTVESGGDKQKQRQKQKQKKKTPPTPPAGGSDAPRPAQEVKRPIKAWLEIVKQSNEKAIAGTDPIFQWAKDTGLGTKMLQLAWFAFRSYHLDRPEKKQIDWRATFRTYCRQNYLKLWRPVQGGYELTDVGLQYERTMEAEAKRDQGQQADG